ncbi:hypothetical protein J26TS2_20600 [Shouchella clausii]|uniref:hypothetical protein n=1 Tax=Shouchella tritolerans TaxID=2979466 RepID=UPI001B15F425|nr:hypothetical protein [Shouchella tritolerans]GIN12193.1 hypothetical protein J26TS2_20600 [Shouchella clausii]
MKPKSIAVFAFLLLVGCEQRHFNSFAEARSYLNELDEFQEGNCLKVNKYQISRR